MESGPPETPTSSDVGDVIPASFNAFSVWRINRRSRKTSGLDVIGLTSADKINFYEYR
jgi:hypothetical protein